MTPENGLGLIRNLGLLNYINSFTQIQRFLNVMSIYAYVTFRHLIGEVSRDPRVPALRRLPLPALINLKDLLDRCQKCLDEFLEVKLDI